MTQPNRLSGGGRIDRDRLLRFSFDGRICEGHPGDSLASALLANGVCLVGRSFKYHRPRGIMTAGPEEPNALMQLGTGARTEPNSRATMTELYDGLTAASQNRWPSLRTDFGALADRLSALLPAGFYYKTFMWPSAFWPYYEKLIRRAAGLGRAPHLPDPDRYATRHAWCDLLVAGGGPAGLAAADAAARSGARVILADEQAEFGGRLLSEPDAVIDGKPAMDWVAAVLRRLAKAPNVTLLPRTAVTGYYDHNFLVALERVTDHLGPDGDPRRPRQRLWRIRARQVVLAQGALERPLVFGDNDRPGVMLAGALRSYIHRYAVLPGRNVLLFANNDAAIQTAIDVRRAGGMARLVDPRPDSDSALLEQALREGVRLHRHARIARLFGRQAVTGAELVAMEGESNPVRVPCDLVAMSGGWTPAVSLFSQGRGSLRYDPALHAFLPDKNHWPCRSAGACNGALALQDCLDEGAAAGRAAVEDVGLAPGRAPRRSVAGPTADATPAPLWVFPAARGARRFHEFQNDATVADIELAAREGYESVEHLKRYTTTGMGTDQGKMSNMNALTVLANLRGVTPPEVGVTTFRPPWTPVTIGALAGQETGEGFLQVRKTPMHPAHVEQQAVFEDVGDWKRPHYFPQNGEDIHAAVARECRTVRQAAGLLDATTLGKIDIRGPDALEFLNRVYVNDWTSLKPGLCRYGVMLNEHGMLFDDGVTTRLGDDHFHMTTTTGGAARVLDWLEEWLQTEWTGLRVYCTSVTEQWAVAALNGPKARDILAGLTDIDLDPAAFPFMSMKSGRVAGVPARVFRISFTGELAYEINVPARYGLHLWRQLMAAGQPYGLTPYGTESMHLLRAEKGFIITGQETDGTVSPLDLGMARMVKKTDFIGRRSLARSDTTRTDRKQLVGLLTVDPALVLPEGTHLMAGRTPPPATALGHVTSAYASPTLGRSIALALVADGFRRSGETLYAALPDGGMTAVTVTGPVFYDKEGTRARG